MKTVSWIRDHDPDRPVEERLVVGRDPRVEAEAEGEVPGGRGEPRVDGELPEAVPGDRQRDQRGAPTAEASRITRHHPLLCLPVDAGPHRQGQVLARRRARSRAASPGLVAEEPQRRLQVERRHVVRSRGDVGGRERGGELVALLRAARRTCGTRARDRREVTRTPRRGRAPRSGPPLPDACAFQPSRCGRKSAERRCLQLVEAGVVADELEVDLVAGAVEAEQSDAVPDLLRRSRRRALRRRARTGSWSGRS